MAGRRTPTRAAAGEPTTRGQHRKPRRGATRLRFAPRLPPPYPEQLGYRARTTCQTQIAEIWCDDRPAHRPRPRTRQAIICKIQTMIRKIDYLRDCGIYRNLQGGSLPAFAKYNLIYGWNYSGKTTLSRLFQVLENPGHIATWPNAAFRLLMDDGAAVTHTGLPLNPPPNTRVFNRDFVLRNFSQEHTAPAVFILGSQNVALRQRLEVLNHRRERVMRIEAELQGRVDHAQDEIDLLGTNTARDVGNMLGDRTFRRPLVERRVEEIRANYAASILADADVTAKYEVCRSTSAWATLAAVPNALPDFTAISARVAALMNQAASNLAIERLKSNRNIESWVRAGLQLHRDSRECEFC